MEQGKIQFNKKTYIYQFLDRLNVLWLVPTKVSDDFYRFEVYL